MIFLRKIKKVRTSEKYKFEAAAFANRLDEQNKTTTDNASTRTMKEVTRYTLNQ